MYDHLFERFGPQQWWPAKTAFEVVIGAYLTQNTAWKSVERSIANLEVRGALTIGGLREISEAELRDRAVALDAPAVRKDLLALPSVGPETADAILLYALDAPAVVVDEYLRRITIRHALVSDNAKHAEIQALAEQAFAPERASGKPEGLTRHYNEFHALVVHIGKTHCGRIARCDGCPLALDLRKARLPVPPHKMKP